MRTMSAPLRIRVPGSTSNLGPGFDLLGLALEIELVVTCHLGTEGRPHELVEREGTAKEWPTTPDNLVFQCFDRVFAERGLERIGCSFAVSSEIPLARGLGSSGAACAAGLLLANAIHVDRRAPLESDALVRLGVELEGHPENSTASLLGGAVLCLPERDGHVHVVSQPIAPSLQFIVAWPETRISTHEARHVLPKQVAFEAAVENPRRLALLLEGLRTGAAALIRAGIEDGLHVPYRLPLIPGGAEALNAAREAGAAGTTISGSGSAVVAITHETAAEAVESALSRTLGTPDGKTVVRRLPPVLEAPRVRPVEG